MPTVARPSNLRCEYLENPLSVDVVAPRLSWELAPVEASARGLSQSAWQVLVASSAELLDRGKGDLWDSGKRRGKQTFGIEYDGRPLAPHHDCWWRVRVWDQKGSTSEWSEPARWSAGILGSNNWQAKWIAEAERPTFEGCKWIWTPGRNREGWFWAALPPIPGEVEEATLLFATDASATVQFNGETLLAAKGKKGNWRRIQRVDLLPHWRRKGLNIIAIQALGGDAENAVSGRAILRNRERLQRFWWLDESVRCSEKQPTTWPPNSAKGGMPARVISRVGESNALGERELPWGIPGTDDPLLLTAPVVLSREITVGPGVKRARLYATALGHVHAVINGRPASDEFFTPGWSDYRKRLYYRCWDVTELLENGESNTLSLTLADGWFAGYVAWGRRRNLYNDVARVSAELLLEYEDGRVESIITDEKWKVSEGPIREADMLMGETHDLRVKPREVGKACLMDPPAVVLESHPGTPVRIMNQLVPRSLRELRQGVYLFDLGQNMVGTVRLSVEGISGREITLRYAETLDDNGELYLRNLRGARCIDSIIPAEDGPVVFEPRFTFHGFRYVEVSGCASPPTNASLVGLVLHSDLREAGTFECSHDGVNKLVGNILWGMKGNYLEIPTDCPQRDERLGWTGDAQAFVGTASCLMDIAPFMTKWLVDLEDSQHPDGAFTHVAPDIGIGGGAAGWGDAGTICPMRIHEVYGDRRILERHYGAMCRWLKYLEKNSDELIRPEEGFGDWLSLNAATPRSLIGTAFFAHSAGLVAQAARALGKHEDAAQHQALRERIVQAFQKRFLLGQGLDSRIQVAGILEGNTQTANVLALAFDLVPESMRHAAEYHLVRDLQIRAYHLSTGFLGLPHLLPVLEKIGRIDLAYRLLLNEDFPSWLYQIKHGATTMWERWDGWSEEFGFQNPEMNSFNHYAYGAVGEWIFRTVGGLDISEAGNHRLLISPRPGGGITHASTQIHTMHGPASCAWRLCKGALRICIRIPVNADAEVRLAGPKNAVISDGNGPLRNMEGVVPLGWQDGIHRLRVGSGHYEFSLTGARDSEIG